MSRVYLGAHFPVDVAAGAGLGLFIGSALNLVFGVPSGQHRRRQRITVRWSRARLRRRHRRPRPRQPAPGVPSPLWGQGESVPERPLAHQLAPGGAVRADRVGQREDIPYLAVNGLSDSFYLPAWAVMQLGAFGAIPASAAAAWPAGDGALPARLLTGGPC